MNKRIHELCMRAISDVDGIENPDTEKMYIPDCFRDRFARLIIDQCIHICLEQRNPQNLNYKPSEKFADEIRRYFE